MLACVVAGGEARANGRYPTSQFLLVGPGVSSEVLALRTTFGIIESLDGGRSWSWLCEDLFGYGLGPPYDPPIALGSRGAEGVPLLAGMSDGLARTSTLCASERVPEIGREFTGDITSVGDGRTVLWVASNGGGRPNRIFASYDGGRSFAPLHDGVPSVLFETLEISASDPMRVYLTGVTDSDPQRAVLYRSDDGGRTLREVPLDLHGGRDAFLSAIDPTQPDTLYLRSTLEDPDGAVAGTLLLRSTDGGAHTEVLLQTRGPMLGFALSGDGQTLWAGGPDDHLLRSERGGRFSEVSGIQVLCLRWHPSGLYACANHILDGFAVGRSNNGGADFSPLLRFEALTGPASCPSRTAGRDLCAARWPTLQRLLGITPTAPDASVPMDAARMDAGPLDAAAIRPTASPAPSCGCHAQRPSERLPGAFAALLLLGRSVRRRRS